jgi:ABC-type transport system involved in cytochrome bd biosynthesis fused ATPase/permease subunit
LKVLSTTVSKAGILYGHRRHSDARNDRSGAAEYVVSHCKLLTNARIVVADPRILILDEPTSSADTRTEAEIQEALLRLIAGRTSLVIAHFLSTIREADELLIIDDGRIVDGRIVERGDHEELLALKGYYYNLYMSQFREQMVANFES